MREMKSFFVYILTALLLLFCVVSKSYQTSGSSSAKMVYKVVSKSQHLNHSLHNTNHTRSTVLGFSSIISDNELNPEHSSEHFLIIVGILSLASFLILYFKKFHSKIQFSEKFYSPHVKKFILIRAIRI